MAKLTLQDVASGYQSETTINENNAAIEAALENTLSRDGTTPNTMGADLDMNSNNILNAATVNADNIVVDGTDLSAQVQAAATSATNAATSETNAATSASAAATSASNAATSATAAASSASDAATSATLLDDWEFLGNWATTTAYAVNNIVYVTAGSWAGYSMICTVAHTSDGTSFDNDYPTNWNILAAQGGSGGGSGDLIAANNLNDVNDAATSLSNLGGQPLDSGLTSIAGLTTAADKMIYTTASDTYATTDLTTDGRALAAATGSAADKLPYWTGSATLGLADLSSYGRTIINFANQTSAFDGLSPLTTQGDIMYHDGTNNVRLAKGTADQQLRMNSGATALEWFTPTSGSLTSGTEASLSGVSSVTFSSIPSGTQMIIISVKGLTLTGGGDHGVRIGDSGGIETTGYTSHVYGPLSSDDSTTTYAKFSDDDGSGHPAMTGHVILTLIDSANFDWVISSSFTFDNGSTAGAYTGTAHKALSAELDRVQIISGNGVNWTAGSVNILYM